MNASQIKSCYTTQRSTIKLYNSNVEPTNFWFLKKKKSVSQSFITVPSYNLVYSSKTCSTSLIKLKSPTRKFSSLSLILPLCSVSLLFLVPHTARAHRYHRSRTSLYLILLSTASTIMQSSASCTQVSH